MAALESVGAKKARPSVGPPHLWGAWWGRLLSAEASVSQATVMLMASFLISAMLGSLQQLLFNAQFGAGAEASAFYATLRLRDLFFALIAGRVVSSAVIPVLVSVGHQGGSRAAWRLTDLVLTTLLAVLALLTLVCELPAPGIVSTVLAPGFDAETRELTIALTRIVLVQPLVLAVSAVAIAVLTSRNQFLLTALSLAAHNLGLISGILATRIEPGLGIFGPALGVIAGKCCRYWSFYRACGDSHSGIARGGRSQTSTCMMLSACLCPSRSQPGWDTPASSSILPSPRWRFSPRHCLLFTTRGYS